MMIKRKLVLGAAALAMAVMLPSLGQAMTASNTRITNTVTVNYADAAGTAQAALEASVQITVNLVPSAPLVVFPANQDFTAENTSYNLTYILTATANGPDTYTLNTADTRSNMDDDAAAGTPSVLLGATSVASQANAGQNTLVVPFDGNDSDSAINGIQVGDTIVIDPTGVAEVAVVTAIDESNGPLGNTVTITVADPLANSFGYGVMIGERREIVQVVTTDSVTAGVTGSHSLITTVSSVADPAILIEQTTATVLTVRRPGLTVNKFVRNVTTPVAGADAITLGGTTWYATGVSGNPSDVMEYLIVVGNDDPDAGDATGIVIADPIPQFTTFVPGSVSLDATGDDTFVAQDDGVDSGSAAEFDATGNGVLYVYAGNGGDDLDAGAGNGTGGVLGAGESSRVVFRVTID
ncbi:hypothetical protein [Isoalcanivorax indicus]|uniref:hypothetical protein n=1 Tax=Isoalcanivorax indicus TaxID=2202653 RepID=UPI000DB9F8D4|nr:hypothetical protein [Isoalcanivorax indicus]